MYYRRRKEYGSVIRYQVRGKFVGRGFNFETTTEVKEKTMEYENVMKNSLLRLKELRGICP